MGKQRKLTQLIPRTNGYFAQNEIAILGAKSVLISDLIKKVTKTIQISAKVAYLNASQKKEDITPVFDTITYNSSGKLEVQSNAKMNPYNDRIRFSFYDLLFINGNYYHGEQQILILDNENKSTVLKHIDKLDNIQFVIKLTDDLEYDSFLVDKYPHIKNLNCYLISDIDKISNHIEKIIQQKIPKIKGLVLAGGRSIRMGTDKGLLAYYGKSHRNYAVEILENLNFETYLSVRKEQKINNIPTIEDKYLGLGPFGAICSAFQYDPNSAWLVLATDLPLVDKKIIKLLIKKRNPSKIATTFKGKNKKYPEPLITIWEPKAYPIMLSYLSQGYPSPGKVLTNHDIEIIEIDDNYLTNINSPEEYELVKKKLDG